MKGENRKRKEAFTAFLQETWDLPANSRDAFDGMRGKI